MQRNMGRPLKEIQATIMALENHLTTYGEAWAERGGDFSDSLPVMEEELRALQSLPERTNYSPDNIAHSGEQENKETES